MADWLAGTLGHATVAANPRLLTSLLLNGISLGAVYALLGLGIVLIYKSSGVLNFAHGSMAMFSTYVFLQITRSLPGLGVAPAVLLTVLFGAVLGAGTFLLIFKRMHAAGVLAKVIASLAVAGVLQGMAAFVWRNVDTTPPLALRGSLTFSEGIGLSWQEVLTVLVTLAVSAGLIMIVKHTVFGIALRATAQNRMAARMLGVREVRVAATSWAIGGALAALAGVLVIPLAALTVYAMSGYMVRGFVAAVVGGFVSLPASLIGGFGLGIVEDVLKGTPLSSISHLLAGVAIAVLLLARVERFFALEQELRALEELG